MKKIWIALLFTMVTCGRGKDLLKSDAKFLGTEVGNGGHTVICQGKNEGLLDYHEAALRGDTVSLGNPGLSVEEKVGLVLERIKRVDVPLYEDLKERAGGFWNRAKILPVALPDTQDTGPYMIKTGCKLEQLALQDITPLPGQSKYIIRQDLWNGLNSDQKAGLILHETIYSFLTSYGAKTSKTSRYLNFLFSSKNFETMTEKDYEKVWDAIESADNISIHVGENLRKASQEIGYFKWTGCFEQKWKPVLSGGKLKGISYSPKYTDDSRSEPFWCKEDSKGDYVCEGLRFLNYQGYWKQYELKITVFKRLLGEKNEVTKVIAPALSHSVCGKGTLEYSPEKP